MMIVMHGVYDRSDDRDSGDSHDDKKERLEEEKSQSE